MSLLDITPEELRQLYISKNLKPVVGTTGLAVQDGKLTVPYGECCAIGAILCGMEFSGEEGRINTDYVAEAKLCGVDSETFEKFFWGFDSYNEYWEAVEDLCTIQE